MQRRDRLGTEEYRVRITPVEPRTNTMPDGLRGCLFAGRVFTGFNVFRQSCDSSDCHIAAGDTAADGSHR